MFSYRFGLDCMPKFSEFLVTFAFSNQQNGSSQKAGLLNICMLVTDEKIDVINNITLHVEMLVKNLKFLLILA